MASQALATQYNLYEAVADNKSPLLDNASTFADNLTLPIHRWFRYSAGFSATWARQIIEQEKAQGRRTVLDPFAGSGTTVLEGEAAGMDSLGVEAHPFVFRIAAAKLQWRSSASLFLDYAESLLKHAMELSGSMREYGPVPKLLNQCFPPDVLHRLLSLRESWRHFCDDTIASELSWLALMAILRECSPVGTAQWQYVLPNKTKTRTVDPFTAFSRKIHLFAGDMEKRQSFAAGPPAKFFNEDARECRSIPDGWADLVVTSPPYANNYDYADATRLEMTFAGEISGWADLKNVRLNLVRSCSQHAALVVSQTEKMIAEPLLKPIASEIANVCEQLAQERHLHGGKKAYHTMIAAYFSDMAKMWISLRRVTNTGARVCFVIGDSAPYGVYVPVDKWLGELAVAAGFHSFIFEKTRDRNIKWKNRKHRVPLHEGRLWVEG